MVLVPDGLTLVTGGSGFIGRACCRALAADGPVRALVRTGAVVPGVERAVVRDMDDRAGVRAAVVGARQVVHLAARVHVMHDPAQDPLALYRQTNVEGTRTLLHEAARAGVQRFLLVSSVKAVGEATSVPWRDDAPPQPSDPYGRSKLEAEAVVREEAARLGLEAVIVRLPLVYGPGVGANALQLVRLIDRGWPLPFGAVRNRRSMIALDNVVGALRAALAAPAAAGGTFFVSDGQDLSTPELIRMVAEALGRPARLVPVPPALLHAAGRAGDLLARLGPWPFTSGTVERLCGSLVVDASRFSRVTGFAPPLSAEAGWGAVAAWYRRAHA